MGEEKDCGGCGGRVSSGVQAGGLGSRDKRGALLLTRKFWLYSERNDSSMKDE